MEFISREHAEELAMELVRRRYNIPLGHTVDWSKEVAKLMQEYEEILSAFKPYIS